MVERVFYITGVGHSLVVREDGSVLAALNDQVRSFAGPEDYREFTGDVREWRPVSDRDTIGDLTRLFFPEEVRHSGPDLRSTEGTVLPPHPLDKHWYLHLDGRACGPFTGHEIRKLVEAGQVSATDFVCADGAQEWIPASTDRLLGMLFQPRAGSPPQPGQIHGNTGTIVQISQPNLNMAQAALLLSGDATPKSPGIALVLSLLLCGVGQMYNGQVGKGIAMLIVCFLLWLVLLGWIIWIWSMVDAYSTAKEMNLRYQQRVLAGLG